MAVTASGGPERHHEIDWDAGANSREFKTLISKRRSFVIPALGFVFLWYFGFIALAGYAPDFMGESIYEGFTVGYALALSQFVMTWFLGWLYLRRADRGFDPLAKRAADRTLALSRAEATTDGDGRRKRPTRIPADREYAASGRRFAQPQEVRS
jgi:uncharacterized membrane protein (DUF485 family)